MATCIYLPILAVIASFVNGAVVHHESRPIDAQEESERAFFSPMSKEDVGTQFRLFTPDKRDEPYLVKNTEIDSWNAAESGFKAEYKTKFITHGYLGSDAEWALEMKNALLDKENSNVFIVNWDGGDGPIYEQAYQNIRVVGDDIAHLIVHLKNAVQLKPEDVHLIGHSLGAHASGFAGKNVQSLVNQKVGRISGLDPAGPDFYDVPSTERLDASDALFVDAIHTNWATSSLSGFGILKPIAHFDFYPNGGDTQPGCPTAVDTGLGAISKAGSKLWSLWGEDPISVWNDLTSKDTQKQLTDTVDGVSCSHGRAYELFTASIESSSCNFESLQCASWEDYQNSKCGTCTDHKCVQMGYKADQFKDLVGSESYKQFYLTTSDTYPFCKSQL